MKQKKCDLPVLAPLQTGETVKEEDRRGDRRAQYVCRFSPSLRGAQFVCVFICPEGGVVFLYSLYLQMCTVFSSLKISCFFSFPERSAVSLLGPS